MKKGARVTLTVLSILVLSIILGALGLSGALEKRSVPYGGLIVKGALPQIPYVSSRSFYLLVSSGEREEFIRLDLVFKFTGINQKECFERNDKLFRDVVYRLLKDQRPPKNTVKEWNAIMEERIIKEVSAKLDRCKISGIVVESVQRF